MCELWLLPKLWCVLYGSQRGSGCTDTARARSSLDVVAIAKKVNCLPLLHGLGPARPEYVSEGAKGCILDGAALLRDGHRREAVRVEG